MLQMSVGWVNYYLHLKVIGKLALARKTWVQNNKNTSFLRSPKMRILPFLAVFDTKMPQDTKVCTFPCSLLEISIVKHFSITYVSGINVSHFHHSQPDTSCLNVKKFGFFIFLLSQHEKPKLRHNHPSGKVGTASDRFLGHFTPWGSSRVIMEVDILHTNHKPGKLFHSLQKYLRFENKFHGPGGKQIRS